MDGNTYKLFIQIFLSIFYVFSLIYFYTVRKENYLKINMSFNKKDCILTLIYLAILLALIPLGLKINILSIDLFRADLFEYLSVIFIIILIIAPAEELIFRASLLSYLQKYFNRPMTIIIGSLFFGLLHLANGAQGLNPSLWNWNLAIISFVGGLFFSNLYFKTKSILYPALLHAILTCIIFLFFGVFR